MVLDILIVDDNVVFRETLKALLCKHFPAMSVIEAGNAADAWRKLRDGNPQLVFSDIRIQNENGLELVRRIRQSHPEVILVVIGGYDSLEYREAAYSMGADCYIPKQTASSSDILNLVKSFQSGQLPQWELGADYLNPHTPALRWH
ncbi:MAG: response regulator [Gammaproteobacteria bacterium]|nr:response regulator [Gammaproteobacteria bacterium]